MVLWQSTSLIGAGVGMALLSLLFMKKPREDVAIIGEVGSSQKTVVVAAK